MVLYKVPWVLCSSKPLQNRSRLTFPVWKICSNLDQLHRFILRNAFLISVLPPDISNLTILQGLKNNFSYILAETGEPVTNLMG